ncbi:hypothetical protein CFP65_1088 [Kitasatospora sp. MMS16-BH015]|uniref:hypothetical protein n=1 Tax=Kitasatospora sp. MMS16-BH015 TaxID=2018025 RepID=UPI000CA27FFA|nr:hypothetical protein [Kitasatospora sp. MMS16-BH015]AUG76003.1 hypothetical protein CFP65_1088 [Kitasatospora sp. MMS16-BH015]
MTKLDMTPGAQIPRTDVGPQTAVTQLLSSVAYRDLPVDAMEALPGVTVKKGRFDRLFKPSIGEAYSRALIDRTLRPKRNPLVPSFGTDTRMVVEHCLAAEELRRGRDRQLMLVTLVFGLLALPGTLVWLLAFQSRTYVRKSGASRANVLSTLVLVVAFGLGVLLAIRPPFGGLLGLYCRIVMVIPVVGWSVAKQICLRSVTDLRARWGGLIDGSALAATVPKAVPRDDMDKRAAELRAQLERLTAEQETNIQHYAGSKGVLGAGVRWGVWEVVEDLRPAEGHDDFRAFHPWDLSRKISSRLGGLSRSEVAGGAMPHVAVQHWVVVDIPEGADEIGRPSNADMDGFRMRDFGIQQIANRQTLGTDTRHRLSTQLVLHNGQLVSTLLIGVTVMSNTLRVSVSGYALGPLAGFFSAKPKPKEITRPKTGKFWEEETIQLPLVDNDEVVRQALRAPFVKLPALLNWLGGSITLPEPFSLRGAWADKTWASRFKADDVIYGATPVVNAVLAAIVEFLEEHDINVERFANRGGILKAEMQGVRPFRADSYDAG